MQDLTPENDLTILLVQAPLVWENHTENREVLGSLVGERRADLIVLPEMFTTGFSMKPAPLAETMSGESVQWMQQLAKRCGGVVTGSLIINDGGHFHNRLVWAMPNGELQSYDKRHLFCLTGEQNVYSPGSDRQIFRLGPWRVCPQICYDLRFPVWARNRGDYDLLLYVANWPRVRSLAWNTLLAARAIENQCYVVAVNRVGTDGNNLEYGGESQVISPLGEHLCKLDDTTKVVSVVITKAELENTRGKFPFLNDRDAFEFTAGSATAPR